MYIAPFRHDGFDHSCITLMQGRAEVSSDPAVLLTTVLGSCVATCLYDPVSRVGGMNQFHLAHPVGTKMDSDVKADLQYGADMMERLINRMLDHGAKKSRLRAHVYGGADLHPAGSVNRDFVEAFLKLEGIPISRLDTGGKGARKVEFLAASGKARCRHVDSAAPFSRGTNII